MDFNTVHLLHSCVSCATVQWRCCTSADSTAPWQKKLRFTQVVSLHLKCNMKKTKNRLSLLTACNRKQSGKYSAGTLFYPS